MIQHKEMNIFIIWWLWLFVPLTVIHTQNASLKFPPIPIKQEGDATIIPINTVFPLKGDRAIIARKMLAGLGNYLRGYRHFLYQHDQRKRFIVKHDHNNEIPAPEGTVITRKMLRQSPLFLGFVGTEMLLSLQQEIEENKALILFPLEGVNSIREQRYRNVIYFRPPVRRELEVLADFAIAKNHKTQVAILYEASKWGKEKLSTCLEILKKYPEISILTKASYPQGTVEVKKALEEIATKSPSLVFCLARPRAAYTFIRSALNRGLHETMFAGTSELEAVQKILKSAWGVSVVVTEVVLRLEDNKELPIVQEYLDVMGNFLSYQADSPYYLEMLINMALFEECIHRIGANPITAEGIIATFEGFKDMSFKGIAVDFDPRTRSLSSTVWVNPGYAKPWIRY